MTSLEGGGNQSTAPVAAAQKPIHVACSAPPASGGPTILPQWTRMGSIHELVWSSDGAVVATTDETGEIRVWDGATGELRAVLQGHTGGRVLSATFSPTAPVLVTTGLDNAVRLWDLETGISRVLVQDEHEIRSVSFSADGKMLAIPRNDTLDVVGLDGTRRTSIGGHWSQAIFTRDGKTVLSWESSRGVSAWNAETGSAVWNTDGGKFHYPHQVAVSGDGTTVAFCKLDNNVYLANARTGKVKKTIPMSGEAWSVGFSPDGKRLVVGLSSQVVILDYPSLAKRAEILRIGGEKAMISAAGTLAGHSNHDVVIVDLKMGKEVRRVPLGDSQFALSPNGAVVAGLAGPHGDGLALVDTATGAVRKYGRLQPRTYDVAFSPDGESFVTTGLVTESGHEPVARIWDGHSGALVRTLGEGNSTAEDGFRNLAWSPAGDRIALATMADVTLWSAQTGQKLLRLDDDRSHHSEHIFAFSPDGHWLATSGGGQGEIRVWDPVSGARVRTFAGNGKFVWSLAYSPDGTMIATAGEGWVNVWDAQSGAERATFKGSFRGVFRLEWLRDSSAVVAAGENGVLYAYGIAKKQEIWRVETAPSESSSRRKGAWKSSRVRSMALSPDGKFAVVGTEDHRLTLWDLASRTKLSEIPGTEAPVYAVAWNPRAPVVAVARGAIQLVRIPDGAQVEVQPVDSSKGKVGIAYTKGGLFSGDPEAFSSLRFREGSDVLKAPLLRADQVAARLYRQDLLSQLFGGCGVEP